MNILVNGAHCNNGILMNYFFIRKNYKINYKNVPFNEKLLLNLGTYNNDSKSLKLKELLYI